MEKECEKRLYAYINELTRSRIYISFSANVRPSPAAAARQGSSPATAIVITAAASSSSSTPPVRQVTASAAMVTSPSPVRCGFQRHRRSPDVSFRPAFRPAPVQRQQQAGRQPGRQASSSAGAAPFLTAPTRARRARARRRLTLLLLLQFRAVSHDAMCFLCLCARGR